MATTLSRAPARRGPEPAGKRPFRDNPRLILAGILLLVLSLFAIVRLADRTTHLNPDFLSEAELYALSLADVTMLLALVFVLARNLIKLFVERRRGLPFSRFRLKLVAAFLGLTILPAVLVLLGGSELIRQTTDRWFSQPVTDVLTSANAIAGRFYRDREEAVAAQSSRLAAAIPAACAPRRGSRRVEGGRLRADQRWQRPDGRDLSSPDGRRSPRRRPGAGAPGAGAGRGARRGPRAIGWRRASPPAAATPRCTSRSTTAANWCAPERFARDASGVPVGVVITSDFVSGELAQHARRIAQAYEDYSQLRVLKTPLEGVYLSLFLMMTLLILVSATWMGLYLAKRITRPVHMLAAGAREIGAGHLDHRIVAETRDEFGSLVDAFNSMASELATSQKRLERTRIEMERKNAELDERRRYIETVLERIATGVISIGPDGRVTTINASAARGCSRSTAASSGSRSISCCGATISRRWAPWCRRSTVALRVPPARRLLSPAPAGKSISPRRRRRCTAKGAPTKARSWCSTT